MSGGGLMQLVAYGAQDVFLSGKPQITFFKSVYRRHTNFAMESILEDVYGNINPGGKTAITIGRNGDLLADIQLEIKSKNLPYIPFPPSYLGFYIVEYTEIEIGAVVISKIYGEWMMVWAELTLRKNDISDPLEASLRPPTVTENGVYYNYIQIPLLFWFHNNPGLAIPLIALQYNEVKLNINFRTIESLKEQFKFVDGKNYNVDPPEPIPATQVFDPQSWDNFDIQTLRVYSEYIYLDSEERRQFAQNAHEYLFEQVQLNELSLNLDNRALDDCCAKRDTSITLNFNHPVKSLVWYANGNTNLEQPVSEPGVYYPSKYSLGTFVPYFYESASILLNNSELFSKRDINYFEKYQVYKYFPGLSPVYNNYFKTSNEWYWKLPISTYSFAVRPAEHQPSGTCNFSRIDSASLELNNILEYNFISSIKVWAQNYNVLRIMSGMAGIAYAN